MTTRRSFLKTAACTYGLCMLGAGLPHVTAAAARRMVEINGKRVRTVDIHGHCQIAEVFELIGDHPDAGDEVAMWKALQNTPLWPQLDLSNVEGRLQIMDAHGIDVQAISNAFWYWPDRELGARIVATVNERIAAVCAARPDRFVGLGTLSMQHPDLAVKQMLTGVRELGLRGFMVAGSVNGEELANEKFHPVWATAEELGTLIFIHPNGFGGPDRRFQGNGNLGNVIGNPLETTIALLHLIFEGTLDRYPDLKLCAAHGGGYLPSYAGRPDHCVEHAPRSCKPVGQIPGEYLKRIYFDSLVYSGEGLRHLVSQVGAGQVVLGTDYPAAMGNLDAVDHILSTPGLSDADRIAILGGNAVELLGIRSGHG